MVFFIIVLIISAGCTSAQNVPSTGLKNQNHAIRDTNIKTSSASAPVSPSDCIPTDPVHFQKFFPDVTGYQPKLPLNRTVEYRSEKSYNNDDSMKYTYIATQMYASDNSEAMVLIHFIDLGPCVTDSMGYYSSLYNKAKKIDNFHGYPAAQIFLGSRNLIDETAIEVSNRRSVDIRVDFFKENASHSEGDAVIEKFAGAIDFNGFASVV